MADSLTRLFPMLAQLMRGRGSEPGPIVLDRRRLYILPTRYGLIFGLLLVAMLVGSINYNLSLGYALTFLLSSVLLVAMLHTYRNLLGLVIADDGADAAFAGGSAHFHVSLESSQPRYAIDLALPKTAAVRVDIDGRQRATLPLPAPRRGRLRPGRLVISTVYPLGLFRAWSYAAFTHSALVYPQPDEPAGEFAASGDGETGRRETAREGSEDFAGLRNWQPADSPRHVAWKHAARTDVLATKRFSDSEGGPLLLDWDALAGLDTEARLSRLTAWVLAAEAAGQAYALRLPVTLIEAGNGPAQRSRCLEALALFGLPDEAEQHG